MARRKRQIHYVLDLERSRLVESDEDLERAKRCAERNTRRNGRTHAVATLVIAYQAE